MHTKPYLLQLSMYIHVYMVIWNLYSGTGDSLLVRLTNGSTSSEGRVEVLYNGTWNTICSDHWGLHEGQVVCQQLGFFQLASVTNYARPDQGSMIMSIVQYYYIIMYVLWSTFPSSPVAEKCCV